MKVLILAMVLFFSSVVFSQSTKTALSFSNYIKIFGADKKQLGTATGFIMAIHNKIYLITNWHVVSGRNYFAKGNPLILKSKPTSLSAYFSAKNAEGKFIEKKIDLYKNGNQNWIDIYTDSTKVTRADVVAIDVTMYNDVFFYAMYGDEDYPGENKIPFIGPMMDLFIIGYPFGLTSSEYYGIFKRGTIASEPQKDLFGLPAFYIDATTRSGMSGSPVVFHSEKGYTNLKQEYVIGSVSWFVGVYSAQDTLSELGLVWKKDFIIDYLKNLK